MKKISAVLFSLCIFASSFAQKPDYKKTQALGVSFFLNDFKAASDIRSHGLINVLDNHNFFKTSQMNPGVAVHYLSGLSNHADFIATLGGSFLDYPNDNFSSGSANLLLEATAALNLKLLTDHYWVTPFIDLGVGASKYKKYVGAFVPVGLGLQVNFLDDAFLMINSQYRIPVTENASYHFYHSIGVAG